MSDSKIRLKELDTLLQTLVKRMRRSLWDVDCARELLRQFLKREKGQDGDELIGTSDGQVLPRSMVESRRSG